MTLVVMAWLHEFEGADVHAPSGRGLVSPSTRRFRNERVREMRERTVPMGMPSCCATSS